MRLAKWFSTHWLSLSSLLMIPILTILGQQGIEYLRIKQTNFDLALRIISDDKKYGEQAKIWADQQITSYTANAELPLDALPSELRKKLCLKPREELLETPSVMQISKVPNILDMEDVVKGKLKPDAVLILQGVGWDAEHLFDEYKIVSQLNKLIAEVKAGCDAVQKNLPK